MDRRAVYILARGIMKAAGNDVGPSPSERDLDFIHSQRAAGRASDLPPVPAAEAAKPSFLDRLSGSLSSAAGNAYGYMSARPELSGAGLGALAGAIASQLGKPVGEVERGDKYRRLRALVAMVISGGALGAVAGHYYPAVRSAFVSNKA